MHDNGREKLRCAKTNWCDTENNSSIMHGRDDLLNKHVGKCITTKTKACNASNNMLITGNPLDGDAILGAVGGVEPTQYDTVLVEVDPDQDDLDQDTTGTGGNLKHRNVKNKRKQGKPTPTKTPVKSKERATIAKTPAKTPIKRTVNEKQKTTQVKKTPKKRKISVASCLTALTSPDNSIHSQTDNININLLNDNSFEIERKRVERESEATEQMLIHSKREAELAKKKLKAEEKHRYTIQLQKQADRDNKKAAAERARYEKSIKNNKDKDRKTCTSDKSKRVIKEKIGKQTPEDEDYLQNNEEIIDVNSIEYKVQKQKNKMREMNPLRRARLTFADPQGENNPNIAGQDNGANAWMDAQLNHDIDDEMKYDIRYAKRNLDNNKFYDIDDIPIRGPRQHGPPMVEDIPSDISVEEATNTAEKLMQDDELYICRYTGMMHSKNDKRQPRSEVHRPSATVTRRELDERHQALRVQHRDTRETPYHHNRYRKHRDQRDQYEGERYDPRDWDTASGSDNDDEPNNIHIGKNTNKKYTKRVNENVSPDRWQQAANRDDMRTHEQRHGGHRCEYEVEHHRHDKGP